jgi:hypothetical protein
MMDTRVLWWIRVHASPTMMCCTWGVDGVVGGLLQALWSCSRSGSGYMRCGWRVLLYAS